MHSPESAGYSFGFPNLDQLRIPQNFNTFQTTIVKTVIPIHKPRKQHWIRVHPQLMLEKVAMLELDQSTGFPELFIIDPKVLPSLHDIPGITQRTLRLCVYRPGHTPFLWPLKLPKGSGAAFENWYISALKAAKIAETQWVRVNSNTPAQSYDIITAEADWGEPQWPDMDFNEIFKIAIAEGRIIDSVDNPIIREIRGKE